MTFSVHLQDTNRVKLMKINDKNTIKKDLRHDCRSQDTDLTNRGVNLTVIRSKNE
jgi:hypothetical protein